MKKFIAAAVAVFVTMFGATLASAATPEDCAESDNVPPGIECPIDGNNYPIELPEGGTIPEPPATTITPATPTTVPTGTVSVDLPATGSSGTGNLLQIGALFLCGGLIVAAVSRRRSTAPAA